MSEIAEVVGLNSVSVGRGPEGMARSVDAPSALDAAFQVKSPPSSDGTGAGGATTGFAAGAFPVDGVGVGSAPGAGAGVRGAGADVDDLENGDAALRENRERAAKT